MPEFFLAIISAVLAGLLLDLILNKSSITKKFFLRVFKNLKYASDGKLLIYLSAGGTCRDPMAKAITLKLLENKNLNFNLRVEGMALGPVSSNTISYAARKAIKDIYGEDLLAEYLPQKVIEELLDKADLILVMDHGLKLNKFLPQNKTYVFKDFFGEHGDIIDPWPDGKDQKTLSRYKDCALEIKGILEKDIDKLIKALNI